MNKKEDQKQPTPQGTVELEESQLEAVQGGALLAPKATITVKLSVEGESTHQDHKGEIV